MYITQNLEFYKIAYGELQSKYKKLEQENKKLKDEIIVLIKNKESLNNVYDSIEKRNLLSKVTGI